MFLIVVGVADGLQTLKFHSKMQLHYSRHRVYRETLDRFMSDVDLSRLRAEGAERFASQDKYPAVSRRRTYLLWTTVPTMAVLIGLFVIVYALVSGR